MSLRRNISANFAGQTVLVLLSLAATHLVFRNLGADILGIITFAGIVTSVLIVLADMGLSTTITREYAATCQRDQAYASDLVGSVLLVVWIAYAASCMAVAACSSFLVHHWLQLENVVLDDVVMPFWVLTASLLLVIPRSIYTAVIAGKERIDLCSFANVAASGVQQIGMIFVAGLGGTLDDVATWYVVSSVVGLGIVMAITASLCGLKILRLRWRWYALERNLRFGAELFAGAAVGHFIWQLDKWLVSKFLSASTVGSYGVALGLVSKGAMVPGALAAAAFPAFSGSIANRSQADRTAQYHKLQDLCGYIYIPVSAAVSMLGIVVMRFVLNEEIVRSTWLALVFLAIGQLFLGLQYIPYFLSLAMKKPEISLRANLWTAGLSTPIAIILTVQYGVTGAAFSTIVASLIVMVIFIPAFSRECLQSSSFKWFASVGALSVLGFLSYGLPWVLLWGIGLGLGTGGLIIAYLYGTVMFLLCGWHVIGTELKDLVRAQVRLLVGGPSA